MINYDPQVIYQFADALYRQANQIIISYALLGGLVGLGAGYYVNKSLGLYAVLGAVIAGLIGYALGVQRAFVLKLQAQTALCQVKIEENTRKV